MVNSLLRTGINRLEKEINKLLSKGMANIYLNIFKKNRYSQNVDFLHLRICHQVGLNFKTIKNQRSGSKTVCDFSIILILKRIMEF